jgi:hypothetical protein
MQEVQVEEEEQEEQGEMQVEQIRFELDRVEG